MVLGAGRHGRTAHRDVRRDPLPARALRRQRGHGGHDVDDLRLRLGLSQQDPLRRHRPGGAHPAAVGAAAAQVDNAHRRSDGRRGAGDNVVGRAAEPPVAGHGGGHVLEPRAARGLRRLPHRSDFGHAPCHVRLGHHLCPPDCGARQRPLPRHDCLHRRPCQPQRHGGRALPTHPRRTPRSLRRLLRAGQPRLRRLPGLALGRGQGRRPPAPHRHRARRGLEAAAGQQRIRRARRRHPRGHWRGEHRPTALCSLRQSETRLPHARRLPLQGAPQPRPLALAV